MSSTRDYKLPEGWSFKELNPKKEYHLRAGEYYIGDICYICDESEEIEGIYYQDIYDKTDYESGFYTLKNKGSFLVASTAYGDGGFRDSFGNDYAVDAGNIGILNINLVNDMDVSYQNGIVMNFPKGVKCIMTDRMGKEIGKTDGFYKFSWIDEYNMERSMTIRTDCEKQDDYEDDEE